MKKARTHGVSLSAVLKEATRSYVAGDIKMGIVHTPEIPNAKTARSLRAALKDLKLGRNFSPSFDNPEDAIAYLKKYASWKICKN